MIYEPLRAVWPGGARQTCSNDSIKMPALIAAIDAYSLIAIDWPNTLGGRELDTSNFDADRERAARDPLAGSWWRMLACALRVQIPYGIRASSFVM